MCPCAKLWRHCPIHFSVQQIVNRAVRHVQVVQHTNVQSMRALEDLERSQPSRICIDTLVSPRLHARFGHLLRPQNSPMVASVHSSSADAGWLAEAGCDVAADVGPAAPATGVHVMSMPEQATPDVSPGHSPEASHLQTVVLPKPPPPAQQQDAPRFSNRRSRFRIPR